MKKFLFLFAGLAALSLAAAQVNLFERFDQMPVKGKLMGGSKIEPAAGVEKGALTAKGNKQNFQWKPLLTQPRPWRSRSDTPPGRSVVRFS